jgi:multidrug efflux pump subunit AcrA (membrane-fusion protein)
LLVFLTKILEMLKKSTLHTQNLHDKQRYSTIAGIDIPKIFPRLTTLLIIILMFIIACMFLPWIQTTKAMGTITTIKPEDRLQQIVAPVNGRIEKWYIQDGSRVRAGDKIVEIQDIDSQNIERINNEILATKERVSTAIIATELALKNYNRQKKLFKDGLTSRREMETANITYQKSLGDQKYYETILINSKAMLRRQNNQLITATRDGYITGTLSSSDSLIVKTGDTLATFVPDTDDIVVELYVNGNDIPLVKIGQRVRLIFDGWPSIQFSGWPSVSIGTFPGVVKFVDYTANINGLFRVLVVQDSKTGIDWPNKVYLRLGTKTIGYVQMNEVSLGFEVWRQLNGFPISINNSQNKFNIHPTSSDKDTNK